ncbi:MAG: flavodoxin family protein [Candidatus Methanomethylophilaceae archaeon]
MKRKVLIICACGSKKGFTYTMCSEARDGFLDKGFEVEVVYPINMDISHCTGCGSCEGSGVCIIDDDMQRIYDSFANSDVVIMCTPIHYSGPSSVIKTVIDRFQTLWPRGSSGPSYMACMMCGGDAKPEFRGAMHVFKALSITAGSKWLGELKISGTDARSPSDIKDECRTFVSSIVSMVGSGQDTCQMSGVHNA